MRVEASRVVRPSAARQGARRRRRGSRAAARRAAAASRAACYCSTDSAIIAPDCPERASIQAIGPCRREPEHRRGGGLRRAAVNRWAMPGAGQARPASALRGDPGRAAVLLASRSRARVIQTQQCAPQCNERRHLRGVNGHRALEMRSASAGMSLARFRPCEVVARAGVSSAGAPVRKGRQIGQREGAHNAVVRKRRVAIELLGAANSSGRRSSS